MDEQNARKFNSDQTSRIIRHALTIRKIDTIDYQELLEIGRELGIEPAKIQEAIRNQDAEDDEQTLRDKWLARQRSEFQEHLWTYVVINIALVLINLFSTDSWWFQWPLLGWGIGLALHFRETYHPSEESIEKGIRKMRQKQRRAREKEDRSGAGTSNNSEGLFF